MIPAHTKAAIDAYVTHRRPVGHFILTVQENNLTGAFGAADKDNRAALFEIVKYCWNEIPAICWGSPTKVEKWLVRMQPCREDDAPNYGEYAVRTP